MPRAMQSMARGATTMREMTRRTTVAVEPPGLVAGPESTLPPAPLAEQVGGAKPKSGSEIRGSPIEHGPKVANGLNPSAVVYAPSNVLKDAYVRLFFWTPFSQRRILKMPKN